MQEITVSFRRVHPTFVFGRVSKSPRLLTSRPALRQIEILYWVEEGVLALFLAARLRWKTGQWFALFPAHGITRIANELRQQLLNTPAKPPKLMKSGPSFLGLRKEEIVQKVDGFKSVVDFVLLFVQRKDRDQTVRLAHFYFLVQ